VRKPAWILVIVVLVLCVTVDYLNRNLKDPEVPALFYGVVLSAIIWWVDRRLHRRANRR
jgi:hypothetical protein